MRHWSKWVSVHRSSGSMRDLLGDEGMAFRWMKVLVAATSLAVLSAGCSQVDEEVKTSAATNDATANDAVLATATLAAATDPTISITSPVNNSVLPFVPQGADGSATSVTIQVEVDNVVVGPGGHFYNVYLDGEFYASSSSLTGFEIEYLFSEQTLSLNCYFEFNRNA